MEAFTGEIRMVAFRHAPYGWALCDGQLIQVSSNQALYSLIGTTYGGDGTTTFALPDLRGRVPIHAGQGPGTSSLRSLGGRGGVESVALTTSQIPSHTHQIAASSSNGSLSSPGGNFLAATSSNTYADSATPDVTLNQKAVIPVGGSQRHENMPPFQVVNFIICLEGEYPPRP